MVILFENLTISSYDEEYMKHQGQYPVINLTLKSAKQPTYELAYNSLVDEIATEYQRHAYLLQDDTLTTVEKQRIESTIAKTASAIENAKAIGFLSGCLHKYYDQKVIILIDEYDVPLENAYFRGFYTEMIDFIRSLFESAFKTNSHLEFAVITGCLRISRESIFTGLNNLEIHSVLSHGYSACFGFTESEIKRMLSYYNVENKFDEIKSWYDGYIFGDCEIYNPWSIINYVKATTIASNTLPKPYWSNTSSNDIIKELVENADFEVRQEIESLIAGKMIEKPVHEDITYDSIHESKDNLWNFLYFTGYLKKESERQIDDTIFLRLSIPNREVRSIYRNTVLTWFDKRLKNTDMTTLRKAIETGDCEAISNFVSEQLLDSISFFDYVENYYHGFLTGLFKALGNYLVVSNRESGIGRPDIILKTPSVRGSAVILELKIANKFQEMQKKYEEAIQQIEDMQYEKELREEGYSRIRKYGVCFYRKDCMVMED